MTIFTAVTLKHKYNEDRNNNAANVYQNNCNNDSYDATFNRDNEHNINKATI